ncbi:MAG: 50S ribosomal protein L4 [Armatimonadota bacterium]
MGQVKLLSQTGQSKGDITVKDDIFSAPVRADIIHSGCVMYLNNKRRGTSKTKDRSEVRGGGAKPWKQKGTGRARVGSIRSPLWEGGGITFGPRPRDYKKTLPKKVRQFAIKSALSARFSEGKVIFVDSIKLDVPKTKDFMEILSKLKVNDKVLVVVKEKDSILEKSAGNLKNVKITTANRINPYDIISNETIILTKDSVDYIEEVMS